MNRIVPAENLRIQIKHIDKEVNFIYDIDNKYSGELKVTYPFRVENEDSRALSPIGVGVAAFLAQLCLARNIILDFPSTNEQADAILPLIQILYDVRCWKDKIDLMSPPKISIVEQDNNEPVLFLTDNEKKACLLWSGGKDSTFSNVLLAKNGFTIYPIHFTINARKEQDELSAVRELAGDLNINYHVVDYQFPEYLTIAKAYANNWDRFPYNNAVPFGRDLALGLLLTLVNKKTGASYLCMGHEHDSKSLYFTYQNKSIARNDVESTRGALILEAFINKFVSPTIKLLPPVGGMPEYRILYELYTNYPEIMSRISFCFWSGTCGRCSKCLRYYLVGRVLGKEDLVNFQVNPLEGDNNPELLDYLNEWNNESLLYRDQVLYCLANIVEKGDIRKGEYMVEKFGKEVYPLIKNELDQMKERLMRIYPDPQVPNDFLVP